MMLIVAFKFKQIVVLSLTLGLAPFVYRMQIDVNFSGGSPKSEFIK